MIWIDNKEPTSILCGHKNILLIASAPDLWYINMNLYLVMIQKSILFTIQASSLYSSSTTCTKNPTHNRKKIHIISSCNEEKDWVVVASSTVADIRLSLSVQETRSITPRIFLQYTLQYSLE